MAKIKYNVVMHSVSGIIGGLLAFRQRFGKTIICRISKHSNRVTSSQLQVRERFRKAVAYAKDVIKNPSEKQRYQAFASGDLTAFNLALSDYLGIPRIEAIETSQYTGEVGSKLTIRAKDNFM